MEEIIRTKVLNPIETILYYTELLELNDLTLTKLNKILRNADRKSKTSEDLYYEDYKFDLEALITTLREYLNSIGVMIDNVKRFFITEAPNRIRVSIDLKQPIKISNNYITKIIVNHSEKTPATSSIIHDTTLVIFKPL